MEKYLVKTVTIYRIPHIPKMPTYSFSFSI